MEWDYWIDASAKVNQTVGSPSQKGTVLTNSFPRHAHLKSTESQVDT